MTSETVDTERRVAGSAALTAASVIASMVIGGLLAIFVLLKFGKGTRTDGFFAAYGVYAVLLTVAVSLRATVVARLVEGPSLFANLDRFLGAALFIFLASGIPLVALGAPIADVLTGDLGPVARDTARSALEILWIAAGAQLVGALGAATLGARDEFGLPGLAYVLGGALSIGLLFGLSAPLGIDAVAVGVAGGSVLTAALIFWRLARAGYRPRLARPVQGRQTLGAVAVMLTGSVGSVGLQVMYVLSLAFAARIGAGTVTLYTYAFFAATLVIAAIASPAGIVLAAPLSRTWDRRPEWLEPHLLAVFRAGLALIVPVIAVTALIGDELVELVLGGSLDSGDADSIVATFLALSGVIVASIAAPVPMLAAFAGSRYGGVAALTAIGAAFHAGASAVALQIGELEALGVAASVSALFALALLIGLVYGRRFGTTLALLGRELGRVVLLGIAAFLPVGVLSAALGGGLWQAAASVLGLGVFAFLLRRRLPEHWELVLRILEPIARRRVSAAQC